MTHFLAYLIVINLVAFLALAVTHRTTQAPDSRHRNTRTRNIRGNSRQPADSPAARVLTMLMPLLALADGSVGMLLGLILWERNVNKHNVAWWFETAVGLVAWGMVCAWRCGLVSFNGTSVFHAFNPAVLRGLGIYLLTMNCVTLLVFVADKRIALANGEAPRNRGGRAGPAGQVEEAGAGCRNHGCWDCRSWAVPSAALLPCGYSTTRPRTGISCGGCPCSLYCRPCCSCICMRAGCSRSCRFA